MSIKSNKILPKERFTTFVCILLLTLLTGCFANYGRYTRDTEVYQAFRDDQIPMDYRYYYYHSGSEPIAVIGVQPKYNAGSRMWRDVEPGSKKFNDMIYWIWEDFGYTRFGAQILDPSGEPVGIMYTSVREVAIKFMDNNRIMVMPHTPFLWGEVDDTTDELIAAESDNVPSSHQQASK